MTIEDAKERVIRLAGVLCYELRNTGMETVGKAVNKLEAALENLSKLEDERDGQA